jgi:1,4-dihydroxy-6-naphthoate synthase
MQLKLAISTCPNDTFMFEAIINQRIDTLGYKFELILVDIDELNQMASEGIPDISKISFNAYPGISEIYQLSRSGAAIGFGNGPLIISKNKIYPEELPYVKVAIPGIKTTANLLLETLYPNVKNKRVCLFSDIEEVLLDNEADAGVIIHETRFTYHKRGLQLVADLGHVWEKQTNLPLPLGGIVMKRKLLEKTKKDIQHIIAQSVQHALNNPDDAFPFVKKHAQELNDTVIRQHIHLYVNALSTWINQAGETAVRELLKLSAKFDDIDVAEPIFVS